MQHFRTIIGDVLGRWKLSQKIAALGVALLIPTVLLGSFYLSDTAARVRQAREERDGARYLNALVAFSGALLIHRDQAFTYLNGDSARGGELTAQQDAVDARIAVVDKVDAEVGTRLATTSSWQSLKSEWSALKDKSLKGSAELNEAAYAAMADHTAQLIELVSARAQTASDSDAQTHPLIDIASYYAPRALVFASSMRRHAVHATAKGYLGGDDRMGIQNFHERLLLQLEGMSRALDSLEPEGKAQLLPALDAARAACTAFDATLQQKLLKASSLELTPANAHDAGAAQIGALTALASESYAAFDRSLQHRLSALTLRRNVMVSISAIMLVLALILALRIARSLSTRLGRAASSFARIAAGDYDSRIDFGAQDEAGQVLKALEEMQGKLRTQIQTERAVAAENVRIRQALDKTSISVVLADGDQRIIYLNDAAHSSFARNAPEITRSVPGFDPARLMGGGLDAFSNDGAAERRFIERLTGPQAQERVLGALTFRTVANPVMSDQGERLGTVVEWTPRTQEKRIEAELQDMLSGIITGDLDKRIELSGKSGFFEAMSRGINRLADNMLEIVSQVTSASDSIHERAQEICSGNANLSQRTEQQSSSLEETASSMEQMTSTVKQNADNASQANQLAVAARGQAEQGGAVVGRAVNAMSDINEASKKIADIIGVIDEIAFQTNLLALNAAVEAARAGEQGRGFAVVASEVRSLAGRSATAAKQIKELIQDSVRKVNDGSALVTQSGQTLEQIVTSVKKVSDIVAEIAAASREQSSGIEQVNRAVMQMDELTQQNAALVEQATAASQSMAAQVLGLKQMLERLRSSDMSASPLLSPSPLATLPAATPARFAQARAG